MFGARFSFGLTLAAMLLGSAGLADDAKTFDYREITLENGLKVLTLEDFSCPIVAVHLWYHVGSKDENPERQGFAHMFEHMMFRGTDKLGPTDHFDLIRATGGECNAYTSFDNTTYVQELPANQLEMALWLEAERMTHLKIDQSNFDTERKVVEEERRLGLNRPYGTVPEKLLAEIFKKHPYQWTPIGRIPHLRAASVGELREFWTKYYVPNNATLVVVGAVKHADAQAAAKKYFGWIPRSPEPPRVTIQEPPVAAPMNLTIKEENAPAPIVGVVYRGVPVGHDDYLALQLLATILGGGESSRIYRDLVAEQRLAVVAVGAAFSLEQDGFVGAGAVLSPLGGKLDKVQEILHSHFEKLRTEPVTEQELTKARNQMLRGQVTETLTVVSKATALGNAAVLEHDPGRLNNRMEKIRKLTPDDLLKVAKVYFDPQKEIRARIEGSLLGSLFGKKNTEESAPITATPETEAPAPGRAGATRPPGWPTEAPKAQSLDFDPTLKYAAKTLPNGLRVLVVENHEVPFINVQLGMRSGAWTEVKPGTASMALGMLTKGTARHKDKELAEELESYGISLGGGADIDTANVDMSCLPEHVERGMNLMAEVVTQPTFPEDEFEKQRQQVLTGLAISTNEPSYVADREFRRQLFGTHPYSRTPTGETTDVQALEPGDLKQWWDKFSRPDTGVLIFSGDIKPEAAFALAEAKLGGWKGNGAPPEVSMPDVQPKQARHIYIVDKPGVQCQIRAGHLGITRDDPAYFTTRIAGSYFGGAFSARLNETIRVKKGLTYGANGGWSSRRKAGEFRVSTFSKVETTPDAVAAVFDEIERLRTEAPSEKELELARSYLIGSFASDRETPQQVAGQVWNIISNGLPEDYYARFLNAIKTTTGEACLAAAQKTVDPSKTIVVVVGPAARIKEGLEKLGPVTVIPANAGAAPTEEKKPE